MLKDLLNDQQLLDVCLTLVASGGVLSGDFFEGPAGLVITAYVIMNNKNYDSEIITEKINSLLTSKIVEILMIKGMVDVDADGRIYPCT